MINITAVELVHASFESEPSNVQELSESEHENLIVTTVKVEGRSVIVSRYSDDFWQINNRPSNMSYYRKRLNFLRVPDPFRAVMKAIVYRYMHRGREGQPRPKSGTLAVFFESSLVFLRYLHSLNIERFADISPIIFTNYAAESRVTQQPNGKPLSEFSLVGRFYAVESLYELSQFTHDAFPMHPWPGTSPKAMAGLIGTSSPRKQGSKTPLMPDIVFCTLFGKAYEHLTNGKALLDLRDAVAIIGSDRYRSVNESNRARSRRLIALGWQGGLAELNRSLNVLRTACYIILASTTGCRNHELANVQSGSHHRTHDDEGNIYHWMRSLSEKTDSGVCDWMIPEAAVRALRLMERWAEPYQAIISKEIAELRKSNRFDPEITNAQKHRYALFLGLSGRKGNQVRTLSLAAWGMTLKSFAKEAGVTWPLASHQFRRKFANYVAHSKFGDLRYLREHFAHWSMDMSLDYAIDDKWGSKLDLDLYNEIHRELEDIKLGIVSGWLGDDSLAGGYGNSIKKWKRDPSNLAMFKNHETMIISIAESTAIRSNGHAWCTADNNECIGNSMERSRCGDCNNAVIGRVHVGIYQELYNNLKQLLKCRDIGESGLDRVRRDIARYRDVFIQLGFDPEGTQDEE